VATVLHKCCTFTDTAPTPKWQIWFHSESGYGGQGKNPCPRNQTMAVQHIASHFTKLLSQEIVRLRQITTLQYTNINANTVLCTTSQTRLLYRQFICKHCTKNHGQLILYISFEVTFIFLKRQKICRKFSFRVIKKRPLKLPQYKTNSMKCDLDDYSQTVRHTVITVNISDISGHKFTYTELHTIDLITITITIIRVINT
jgi:hypothetical protein